MGNLMGSTEWFWAGAGNPSERSLGRERFRGHHFTIGNNHRQKRNQNPRDTQMAYAIVRCPNTC
jgi:hypothetical protein